MRKKIETRNGKHVVVTLQQYTDCFYSYLCREDCGELIATTKNAHHSTEKGALRWAKKQVNQ